MIRVEVTVIGGGIVGCAVAAVLSRAGREVVLLEKEDGLARGTTARNSEVAHGGMYYPTGSLKARCCVRGRRLLSSFCETAGVDYRPVGKLIVAVEPAERPELRRLLELGEANGVEGLHLVDRDELRRLEPEVTATAALLSPGTGILDAEGAARAYAALATDHGCRVMTGAEVAGLRRRDGEWRVEVAGRREAWTHASRLVVNAAGLYADSVAAMARSAGAGKPPVEQVWVKGNYFAVAPEHAGRIRRLVYPVPPTDSSSLGLHVCLDLAGQMRLGPDVEEVGRSEDYGVDPDRAGSFLAGARRFLPWLRAEDLSPAFSGLRPKLGVTGFHDFVVRREQGGADGLVNLLGIDSPGLTSAPALAEEVLRLIGN